MKRSIISLFVLIFFGSISHAQELKIKPNDGSMNAGFGNSVSISGDFAIIGADEDDTEANNKGSAYIYWYDGTTWTQQAKLTAQDGAADDYFGCSVAIYNNYAVVGAYLHDSPVTNGGAAYVFENNGGQWNQVAKLSATGIAAGWMFGYSVEISDGIIIVGAPGDGTPGWTGLAVIFEFINSGWTETATISPSAGVFRERFGCSVSKSGNYVVIGADKQLVSAEGGSVYIFEKDGQNNWTEIDKISPSDGFGEDDFGNSVSMFGDYILVGTESGNFVDFTGSAYIFKREGNSWVEQTKLIPNDGTDDDRYGSSVSIYGNFAFVGAESAETTVSDHPGAVYIFQNNSDTWTQTAKLEASDGGGNDSFGISVAASSTHVIIGADGDYDNGANSGSAYIFTDNDFITGIQDSRIPLSFSLHQNYPNPFNPSTNISFEIAEAGNYRINIFNSIGQKIGVIKNSYLMPGSYTSTFNSRNLPSGIYIYQLEGEKIRISKKMMVLK